jgi:hypothetical protein
VGLCGCAGQVGDGGVSVEAVMWQLMEVPGILAGRGKKDLRLFEEAIPVIQNFDA